MLAQNDAPPQKPASKRIFTPQTFHKRTRQRFARQRTVELTAHLGRALSYPEQIIVSRIIAVEWDLRRLDAKLDAGEELSGHAMRARLAAENRLRLDLVALGLQPPPPPKPTWQETVAELHRQNGQFEDADDGAA